MRQASVQNGKAFAERRNRILSAALSVFSEVGFERATMDRIACRAGTSKPTVYHHFQNKDTLFVSCVLRGAGEIAMAMDEAFSRPPSGLAPSLLAAGEQVSRLLLSPASMDLRRLIISTVSRFPDLGQAFYQKSTAIVRDGLARLLKAASERREIDIEDPMDVASQFSALCLSQLQTQLELRILMAASRTEIHEAVERALRLLFRAYRPASERPQKGRSPDGHDRRVTQRQSGKIATSEPRSDSIGPACQSRESAPTSSPSSSPAREWRGPEEDYA